MTGTQILTVNAGSTSVRLGLFAVERAGAGRPWRELAREKLAASAGGEAELLRSFLTRASAAPELVAHRVVHGGGPRPTGAFDTEARAAVAEAAPLAPLHNPPTLAWLAATDAVLPRARPLAVFDTTFYAGLPAVAATYGLPRELTERLGLRRLGFHGLAHRSMWQSFAALSGSEARPRRVISLQLGGGCSATALLDGRPVETSMGFSPLEGLLMASRPGDLDPGLLLHLMEREGLSPAETRELLHRRCGLLGVSGGSSDMRLLLASEAPPARLAVELFCHRARKYLGAYLAVLGGCDAVLIGGGVGEHAPEVRRRILSGLDELGIRIDEAANAGAGAPRRISDPAGAVAVWVVPTDEESILAEEACAWLARTPAAAAPDLQS